MRKLIIILFCFLSVISSAQDKRMQKTADNLLVDAVRLLGEGDAEGAQKRLDLIEKLQPGNDAMHFYKGRIASARKDVKEAERRYTEAVRLDSSNVWYRSTLAEFYAANCRQEESSAIYLSLMKSHPGQFSNAYTYTLLADSQLAVYKDSLALVNYDNALMYDPGYVPALLGKAEVYRMRNKMPSFFAALDPFLKDADVFPKAKCDYVRAILNHVDGRAFRAWNVQLDSMVNSCVNTHPTDSNALQLAGGWYYGTGRKPMAMKYFNSYIDNYPDSPEPHFIRVQMLSEDKDWAGVIQECKLIEALPKADKATRVSAFSIMGDTYHQIGDRKRCYEMYDKALAIDPNHIPVLNNYAYFLSLEKRKLAKAERMSLITVESQPDNPTYLDTYGWILYLRGKAKEAKPHFKHAMIYGGKDSKVILEHYSIVLHALGEEDLSQYYKNLADAKK